MRFYQFLGRSQLLLVLLLSNCLTRQISLDLPELRRYDYTHTPQTHTIKSKEYFRQEFENALNPNVSFVSSNANMSHDCVFTGMSIEPRDLFEIKLNTLEGNLMSSFITDMVVVKSEKLVYTVTNKLTITAYSYADNELKKLVGKDLDYSNDPTEGNVDNAAVFALMQDESALYLFSKKGTYLIETKTILEKIKVLKSINADAQSAAVMGQNIILVGPAMGMNIYRVHPDYTLQLFKHVTTYEQQVMSPASVAVDQASKLIYVLGASQNIYIFTIWNNDLHSYDIIEFQHLVNFMIKVDADRLYYSFVDGGNMKVAELHYNSEIMTASLIRYYKMFDYIYDFRVFGEQLYALTQETIEIVPVNVDPRIITKEHNGVRLSMKARKMALIAHQTFVFVSQQSLRLTRLRTHNSRIECKFLSEHSNTVTISFRANLSRCDSSPKPFFNSYCEIQKVITINVDIPEETERQKTLLYSVVVLVTVLFLVGLVCLIQWRNGRLDLIDRLAHQIRQFRSREKHRPQQLHQENQIEIPQVVTERDDFDRKQRNL